MPPRPTRTHPRSHDSPNRSSSSYEDAGPLNAQLTPSRSSSDPDREEEDVLGEQGHAAEIFRLRPMPRRIDDDNDRKGSGAMDADGEEDEGQHFLSEQGRRQSDSASVASFELYTPDEGRAVLKKLDRRVVVLLALLYLLSFLDRSNIGNARIAGLKDDLRLSSGQYEWVLTAFYITYISFEWMTLMYRIIPPHIYIALCVFFWGLVASLQSVTTSFASLLALRALLGITEAAFGPGVPFYLSFFYRRDELALRTGFFISAAPLATSFASSLAYGITRLGQGGPIAPWRLLFLVEGFPSVVVAAFAWELIPDSPETAKFLTTRERRVAVLRLRQEREVEAEKLARLEEEHIYSGSKTSKGLSVREILQTLTDTKAYLTAFMFFSCNIAFSSMPVFLPTIVHEMGYDSLTSQGLSAPPFLFAFVIVLVTAFLSDRYRSRSSFILFHSISGAAGYFLIVVASWYRWPVAIRYLGVFPACAGFFSAVTLVITWSLNNQDSASKRGTGIAMLNIIGQCGPLVGTRLYPDSDAPFYVRGMLVCAAFMLLMGCLSVVLRLVLRRENKKRLRAARESEMEGEMSRQPFLFII